jgi:hypothetical protein
MKALEVISGILAGAIFLTYLGYLAVRLLGNCRDNKDEYDRKEGKIYHEEAKKYIMPKK